MPKTYGPDALEFRHQMVRSGCPTPQAERARHAVHDRGLDGKERMEKWSGGRGFWWTAPVAIAMLIACIPPALCDTVTIDGVIFPPTHLVEGHTLQLNGAALRTVTLLHIHAYAAALYLEHPGHDTDAIEASSETKMLILTYLRVASKERVRELFRRSATRYCNAGDCPASDVRDFERLIGLLPAVQRGDSTTYIFSPRGVQVLMNDAPLATFDNPGFARRLLDAFIGLRAAAQSLRESLLGEGESR